MVLAASRLLHLMVRSSMERDDYSFKGRPLKIGTRCAMSAGASRSF
jgi:hypothetical protein